MIKLYFIVRLGTLYACTLHIRAGSNHKTVAHSWQFSHQKSKIRDVWPSYRIMSIELKQMFGKTIDLNGTFNVYIESNVVDKITFVARIESFFFHVQYI